MLRPIRDDRNTRRAGPVWGKAILTSPSNAGERAEAALYERTAAAFFARASRPATPGGGRATSVSSRRPGLLPTPHVRGAEPLARAGVGASRKTRARRRSSFRASRQGDSRLPRTMGRRGLRESRSGLTCCSGWCWAALLWAFLRLDGRGVFCSAGGGKGRSGRGRRRGRVDGAAWVARSLALALWLIEPADPPARWLCSGRPAGPASRRRPSPPLTQGLGLA
jgi:hypothetical protein